MKPISAVPNSQKAAGTGTGDGGDIDDSTSNPHEYGTVPPSP